MTAMQEQLSGLKEELLKTDESMTITKWIRVADCPIQRNTEKHAKFAANNHLKEPSITHYQVYAARLPNGKTYKLDGHTRALLWKQKKLARMIPNVSVTVFHVKTLDDVYEMYTHFDNANAAENTKDRFHGALRAHGVKVNSSLCQTGGMTTGIYFWAYPVRKHGAQNAIYDIIEPWIPCVQQIDDLGFTSYGNNSGIIAAMLITFARDGNDAKKFWQRYGQMQGIKTIEGRDGVEALTHWMDHRNENGRVTSEECCARAITCYEYFQTNMFFPVGRTPQKYDLLPFRKLALEFMAENGCDMEFDLAEFVTAKAKRDHNTAYKREVRRNADLFTPNQKRKTPKRPVMG